MSISIARSEACALLNSLEASSVQVIFADPPYGIAYHSNYYKERNPHAPISADWNFQIGRFMAAVGRALSDGGAMYLCTRWDVYPLWAPEVLAPLKLTNLIVWAKDNWSAGDLGGNFGGQHELLMFITKGRHLIRGKRWSNIWQFPRIPAKKLRMPAEKPLGLVERAVSASSDQGALVVDPFCGSGTTGETARTLGRQVLLGDIDPKMIRLSCERLALPPPDDCAELSRPPPPCPIFQIEPPAPHLWGVHPEDVAHILGRTT